MNIRIKLFIECPMKGDSNGIITHGDEKGVGRGVEGVWKRKLTSFLLLWNVVKCIELHLEKRSDKKMKDNDDEFI